MHRSRLSAELPIRRRGNVERKAYAITMMKNTRWGHRCERPQLFMIEDAPHMEEENGEEPPQEADTQELLLEISFHTIVGVEHPQTLRVLGKLNNKNLMVLID